MATTDRVRVYNRFLIASTVSAAYRGAGKTAAVLPPQREFAVFVEAFALREGSVLKEASLAGKVKDLLQAFRKAPNLWEKIKGALDLPDDFDDMNPIKKLGVLADKLKDWIAEGKRALMKVFDTIKVKFPLNMFFVPDKRLPSLTDLLERLVRSVPWMSKALDKAKGYIQKADDLMNKYLPTLKRPLLAVIFGYVWFSVAELSWDIPSIVNGFLGNISLGELFASLPESGLGLLASAFGLGYGALPVTLIARLLWLVAQNYLEWVPGKGLRVRWDRLGIESDGGPDLVPV
jgi:hypothetical protein